MMVLSQWPLRRSASRTRPDLGVDEGDAGVVGLHVFAAQGVVLDAQLEPERLVAAALRDLGGLFPEIRAGRFEDQVVARIELEILVRSKKRARGVSGCRRR